MSEVTQEIEKGRWVILELFGHKVIAGYMSTDESLGAPLIRLDVPETRAYPAFTRHYNPSAIYSVSYVSQEAVQYTAEAISENPVSVYVPELGELTRLQQENKDMKETIFRFQQALSKPRLSD
ncbi:MAG: hypothetical protein GYA58_03425 [Anaerolineaceae bacterium]|nr:hypothetical protein [Anaerolineaceae bacterium]